VLLVLRFGLHAARTSPASMFATLVVGLPLVYVLLPAQGAAAEFGSDLLGGISIITAVLLGEYRPAPSSS
jgi:hypothetical protein